MKMENFSPFPNLRFYNTDNQGREFGILVVKGTYTIGEDGWLKVADDQEPLILTDTYHGVLNTSSLRIPSDIVPKKPRSDVILNAVARAPGGEALPSWTCGVRVVGEHVLEKRLRITGPRFWEPIWGVSERARATMTEAERRRVFGGWRLSPPEPASEVPLRYERAYGGLLARPQDGQDEPFLDADEHNPIGCGWIDAELTPSDKPVSAPQIEDAEVPITEPHRSYDPAGFGPIPPAWLPRRPLGGTYDDHWKEKVWPNWPEDYDFAFHNSANPALIYPDILIGDETVRLSGLGGENGERLIRLPVHALMLQFSYEDREPTKTAMNLDTLFLDIADADPSRHRVFLTWRETFDHEEVEGLSFGLVPFEGGPDFAEFWQPVEATGEQTDLRPA